MDRTEVEAAIEAVEVTEAEEGAVTVEVVTTLAKDVVMRKVQEEREEAAIRATMDNTTSLSNSLRRCNRARPTHTSTPHSQTRDNRNLR